MPDEHTSSFEEKDNVKEIESKDRSGSSPNGPDGDLYRSVRAQTPTVKSPAVKADTSESFEERPREL